MKYAIVRFLEDVGDDDVNICFLLVSGEEAESQETFIEWHNEGVLETVVLDWFEVPENWVNVVTHDSVNDVFEALLGLDALSDTPQVSDLFTTIFAAGFACGKKCGQI